MNLDFDIESIASVEFSPVQTNPKLPIYTIILTIVFLPISAIFMILGSTTINSCSLEPNLPIWMIFLGSFLAIDRGIAWIFELDLYLFKRNYTRPDEGIKELKEWEFEKSGLKLRLSNYSPVTICGLIFFALIGSYYLQKAPYIPESGECNEFLILISSIFCALILLPCFFGLILLFISWIFLWLLKCFCA